MKTFRIILLLLTGMLLQSCGRLNGTYIGHVSEIDSTFTITFNDSLNIAHVNGNQLQCVRVGTHAFHLHTKDTMVKLNNFDDKIWQFNMPIGDSILVAYLTKKLR